MSVVARAAAVSNYRKGADKERELVRLFRAKGALCARSAGRKSPVDVWAVHDGELHLIQVKARRERVVIPVNVSCVRVRRVLAYKVGSEWHFEDIQNA